MKKMPRTLNFGAYQLNNYLKSSMKDFAEREALEPTYSRNIIKLQIINNQTLFGVHSKSKSF